MPTPLELADAARAETADVADRQLSPLGLAAMDALSLVLGQSVLDVGCGAGQTVEQLAQRVGETGHVTGVDIGGRSLAVARSRTAHLPHVTLLHEDAAQVQLPDASIDAVYSRFGVMFFDDPVAAFSNFHRVLRRDGRLSFVCWRSWAENEIDRLPVEAAGLSDVIDKAPFSFEQADHITRVLSSAGFLRVEVQPFDALVSCGGVDDTLFLLTKVGALGRILRNSPDLRAAATPRVRAALVDQCDGGEVELGAAVWIVTATVE